MVKFLLLVLLLTARDSSPAKRKHRESQFFKYILEKEDVKDTKSIRLPWGFFHSDEVEFWSTASVSQKEIYYDSSDEEDQKEKKSKKENPRLLDIYSDVSSDEEEEEQVKREDSSREDLHGTEIRCLNDDEVDSFTNFSDNQFVSDASYREYGALKGSDTLYIAEDEDDLEKPTVSKKSEVLSDQGDPLQTSKGAGAANHTGYCYSEDPKPYMGFASMTPYSGPGNISVSSIVPKGCIPRQIWLLMRPGTYSATNADRERFEDELPFLQHSIIKSHSLGNGKLCHKDLSLLRNWELQGMELGLQGTLTRQGKEEIAGIATRFKTAFPGLVYQDFHLKLNPKSRGDKQPGRGTKFAFAPSRQTYETAVAFVKALYSDAWGHLGLPTTGVQDLQFIDICPNYIDDVILKPKEKKPYHRIKKGKHMLELRQRVSERLGVKVSLNTIRSMYNACRYQKALDPLKPSPWCVPFTIDDLKVLEYWEDLRMQHDHGGVHEIAYKPACILAKNLILNFLRKVKGKKKINSTVNFANAEVIMPFAALFGLFNDSGFLNETTINDARSWQTSKFAGFGSNFAFILSFCEKKGWWVSAAFNESPLQLPRCETPLGCSLQRFIENFSFRDCNFRELCGPPSGNLWHLKTWQRYYSSYDWL